MDGISLLPDTTPIVRSDRTGRRRPTIPMSDFSKQVLLPLGIATIAGTVAMGIITLLYTFAGPFGGNGGVHVLFLLLMAFPGLPVAVLLCCAVSVLYRRVTDYVYESNGRHSG